MRKKKQAELVETKKLKKALIEERKKSGEYFNRLTYLQADFENYRKRMERNLNVTIRMSKEKVIFNLLSIIDELELALLSGRETENKQALLKGVGMTLKKMHSTLRQEGLVMIKAVGKPFDPKLHEVAMKVRTKKHQENIVVEEVRRGYMFGDKVIRPSVVKIATRLGGDHE